jgi:hypothetical protein
LGYNSPDRASAYRCSKGPFERALSPSSVPFEKRLQPSDRHKGNRTNLDDFNFTVSNQFIEFRSPDSGHAAGLSDPNRQGLELDIGHC